MRRPRDGNAKRTASNWHSSQASIPVRPDGTLRLAVVADTHSKPHPRTAEHLAKLAPDAILHAGDIGDTSVLTALSSIAPLHAVRGNIDVRAAELPDALTINLTEKDHSLMRLLLVHIGVAGPRIRTEVAQRARQAGAGLVICGHSHVPFIGADRGLIVFNPGSVGPRRFQLPIVFGLLELHAGRPRLSHVDAETGQPWMPPGFQ